MKKLLCALLAALLLLCGVITVAAETVYTIGDWTVQPIADGTAYTVDSCASEEADITVPAQLGGLPVTAVSDFAFMNDKTVYTVTLSEPLDTIGEYAFTNTALEWVTLPLSLTQMGEGAFARSSALAKVNLADTALTAIPDYAFTKTSLTDVALPESCTAVGEAAFSGCAALNSIRIPASVESIGEDAFKGCPGLVIRCEAGSYAEEYAVANGIAVQYIPHDNEYRRGDADGDGTVTIMDATKIQRLIAELEEDDASGIRLRGDVDGSGLDILDATAIQRYLADMGNPYGIDEIVAVESV